MFLFYSYVNISMGGSDEKFCFFYFKDVFKSLKYCVCLFNYMVIFRCMRSWGMLFVLGVYGFS